MNDRICKTHGGFFQDRTKYPSIAFNVCPECGKGSTGPNGEPDPTIEAADDIVRSVTIFLDLFPERAEQVKERITQLFQGEVKSNEVYNNAILVPEYVDLVDAMLKAGIISEDDIETESTL